MTDGRSAVRRSFVLPKNKTCAQTSSSIFKRRARQTNTFGIALDILGHMVDKIKRLQEETHWNSSWRLQPGLACGNSTDNHTGHEAGHLVSTTLDLILTAPGR